MLADQSNLGPLVGQGLRWQPLPIPDIAKADHFKMAVRLNALGSLYFHTKFVLGRNRLVDRVHAPLAASLEADHRQLLLEFPRAHFKSTLVGEGLVTWWALPFTEVDEAAMRELGYGDEWIAWMRRCHNPMIRILIVSEILDNAKKMGIKLDQHFQLNAMFKMIFKEIIPTNSDRWNQESKLVRVTGNRPHGEGTFDYIGVGGALQSRHYDRVIEDDLVGKDAWESEAIMEKTIDYHKLLEGAFDGINKINYVVGNRWKPWDLNGWIRDNEAGFVVESHGALGGCCERHPAGEPIFIEEFPMEELERIRTKQGPYMFAAQYLNLPVAPEECVFNKDWLRFYGPVKSPLAHQIGKHWLRHDVVGGEVIKDVDPNTLIRSMIVDPNHAEAQGRCHHAIVVTGFEPETDRIYLLDVWARSSSYDDLIANVFKMAKLWNLHEFWLETIAAQRTLKYHIEYRNKVEGRALAVRELKSERSANAKRVRIESLEPLLRANRLWVRRDQAAFLDEYYAYPGGRTVDVLDALGYSTQTWNAIHAKRILETIHKRREKWGGRGRSRVTGY